ncbi:MAG: hypothetical protein V1860_00225, partial [bacterium]
MRKNYAKKAIVYFLAINLVFNYLAPLSKAMDIIDAQDQAAMDNMDRAGDMNFINTDEILAEANNGNNILESSAEEYNTEQENDAVSFSQSDETEENISEADDGKDDNFEEENIIAQPSDEENKIGKNEVLAAGEVLSQNNSAAADEILDSDNSFKQTDFKKDDQKINEQFFDFFKYVPGDIIIKYKNKENNLKNSLKNKNVKTNLERTTVEENLRGKGKNSGARLYKINDLREKANKFAGKIGKNKTAPELNFWQKIKNKIKNLFGKEVKKREDEKNIKIKTDEFGEVEVNLE